MLRRVVCRAAALLLIAHELKTLLMCVISVAQVLVIGGVAAVSGLWRDGEQMIFHFYCSLLNCL